MGNRCLYGSKSFEVEHIYHYEQVWHLEGFFSEDSIRSKYRTKYLVRVKPDPRWEGVKRVLFLEDRIYECEGIGSVTRRHVYSSGRWYVSPYCVGERWENDREEFAFEDFKIIK